ncbi:MAG: hypothetical protein WC277_07765 [Bacilli bacterium]|jgi:hypothetical protein
MVTVSETTIRFASTGADKVVRDEDRVDKAISKTAKNAGKNEKTTERWMERHKTALTAIGVTTAGAMAGVIAASPSLQAALSGVYLEFSMLAMDIGERWAPAFEWLEGIAGGLTEAWDKLPGPLKDVISYGLLVALGFLAIVGAAAGLLWLLGPLTAALGAEGLSGLLAGGLGLTTAAGGLTLLGAAAGILAGLVLGGIVVWALWRTGVLKAVEEVGASVGQLAYNIGVVFGNLKDNLIEWLGLVAASAGLWGSQFALNWVDGIVSNIPFLGDALGPKIDSLKSTLDQAGVELQQRWDEWDSSGGLRDGLTVGWVTPAWQNDPSKFQHPVTDWMDSLFGGGDSSSQAGRLTDLFAGSPAVEIPGYADSMQQLQDLQAQMETFESTAGGSMGQVSESMAQMATNTSTSSSSVVATTQTTTAAVAATYDSLVAKAPVWGSDLMGHFIAGANMQFPALLSTLARIRSAIENALSFDIVRNDLMAERWGSDFIGHFAAGMQGAPAPAAAIPAPQITVAAPGGGTTYSTPVNVSVTVNVSGARAQDFDERRLATVVQEQIRDALRGRGR